jgi:hypothetical protein
MKYTKNEIREKRGKITCIVILILPILVIVGFYIWQISILNSTVASIEETIDKNSKRRAIKWKMNDYSSLKKELLKPGSHHVFTGIENRNDTTFTNALQIEVIDSISLTYKIETLNNWIPNENIEGVAILDTGCIGNSRWKIRDEEGVYRPSYRFYSRQGDCEIEIIISKEKDIKRSVAEVREVCPRSVRDLSLLLRYK